ncbi:hypothetical protein Pfo_023544 [Paulownia fortunei]|nr:hypothetical protein Pfo_023544 [Paulownia fortunei]
MTPHILLAFLICSISILFQWQNADASMAMASRDCPRKCGDTRIPYPFGMKKGCYLDETFKVACNESTGSASLASLGWDIDIISISKYIGNHYWVSHTKHKFVAMGCDFYSYLIDDDTRDFRGGCASLCNRTDIVASPSSSCSGLQCCQINLPKDLRNLTLWVDTMNTLTKSWAYHCGFFTLVDKDFRLNKSQFSACNETYYVPVIYEWAVGNTSCNEARGRVDCVCGQNTECIDYIPGMGYRCECSNGYRGNPYLPEGCQDFDECANPKDNNCPTKNSCVHTAGSYFCLPNRRHILAKNQAEILQEKWGLLLQQQISASRGNVLPELTLFKIVELEKATDKFSESRILGKGGLGTVYKGMLSDGRIVAVKKANITDDSQVGQFINEVFILSQINHRHIVKLFGCCLEAEVPLLVYEYVSNGTLSHHIHEEPTITISWENRVRIAAEVAGALAYLHSCASTAIFHRDIKSSNILLDENYKAVISDFGLSRSVSTDRTHLTTLVGGTFGYLDPEYFRSGQLNDKSDVYGFGVVLAEILTGQKAVSSIKDYTGLAIRFRSAVKEHCLFKILEKVVADEGQKEEILAVAKLAKRCLKVNARKRPNMKEVAAELDQLRKRKELPENQESFLYRSISENCYSCGIDSEAEEAN